MIRGVWYVNAITEYQKHDPALVEGLPGGRASRKKLAGEARGATAETNAVARCLAGRMVSPTGKITDYQAGAESRANCEVGIR